MHFMSEHVTKSRHCIIGILTRVTGWVPQVKPFRSPWRHPGCCPFSFGHCFVCSSSIYGFWLPHWYLQTLLAIISLCMWRLDNWV